MLHTGAGKDFSVIKAPGQGGHFRDGGGGMEEEAGVPQEKGETSSLENLLFLLAQFGARMGWEEAWCGLDTEPPGADVPASLKMSLSTWICLRLSPVAQAGAYPYTG